MRTVRGQRRLQGVISPCPHCGSQHTHLELPLADDHSISADRHRCDDCRGHWWQLHNLPGSPVEAARR
ncbi:MAG TPA: hypothetical protein VGE42_07565 [Candidatus Dormibacteraeota bacterium]